MQLGFLFKPAQKPRQPEGAVLQVGSHAVPLHFIRNPKARRYILRLRSDGSLRATVPRRGSIQEAREFAERNQAWIAKQLQRHQERPLHNTVWQHGTEILYRGERVPLIVSPDHDGNVVQFADQTLATANAANLRPVVERHLRKLAATELMDRTLELASLHSLTIKRVTVRNQRSRWGSCSRLGTISLNWRLLRMPDAVRDYIILHELAHTVEHNHSIRFWRLVERFCPHYKEAKQWIRRHRDLLRG